MRLYPRLFIDLGVDDLLFALRRAASPTDAARAEAEVLSLFDDAWLVTRSVRSGFDLLLSALALPPGSEVLMSALTVPDMWRLVELHGLRPVAVDLDPHTLLPDPDALERLVTERTRLLLVAQLFGARQDLSPWKAVAKRHGLPLVEDLAQAFVGPHTRGDLESTAWLFSFGTIKTCSAMGGALLWVRDAEVREAMRALHRAWPTQPASAVAKKAATLLGLAAIREPRRFRAFERACAVTGHSVDAVLRSATRGFPAERERFVRALRERPSAPMLELLARRLRTFDAGRVSRRAAAGERMLARGVAAVGAGQRERTHWLFAVTAREPDALVTRLRAEGFDAARGTSTINTVPGETPRCSAMMEGILFVPAWPEMPEAARDRLAELLADATGAA